MSVTERRAWDYLLSSQWLHTPRHLVAGCMPRCKPYARDHSTPNPPTSPRNRCLTLRPLLKTGYCHRRTSPAIGQKMHIVSTPTAISKRNNTTAITETATTITTTNTTNSATAFKRPPHPCPIGPSPPPRLIHPNQLRRDARCHRYILQRVVENVRYRLQP